MSRSSVDAVGRRPAGSTRRAQVDPIAALVAVVALAAALGLYAVALDEVRPSHERDLGALTLDRAHAEVVDGGVADPDRLAVPDPAPEDADVRIELRADDREWAVGDEEVDRARRDAYETASRHVTVRVAPGENRPGRLRVVVRR